MSDDLITCRDACGQAVPEDQLLRSGWWHLPISNRWRCPSCRRALAQRWRDEQLGPPVLRSVPNTKEPNA